MRFFPFALLLFVACDFTDYAQLLEDSLQQGEGVPATQGQRFSAGAAMDRFPYEYGLDPALVFEIISLETAGNFSVMCYNADSHARGLMQVTEIALREIPAGEIILKNKLLLYDPWYAIMAGCQYLAYLNGKAKECKVGGVCFSKKQVMRAYYLMGYSRTQYTFFPALRYIKAK